MVFYLESTWCITGDTKFVSFKNVNFWFNEFVGISLVITIQLSLQQSSFIIEI
jgi:hypothetical protein